MRSAPSNSQKGKKREFVSTEIQQIEIENSSAQISTRIPQYRRDLFPKNLAMSADDLREFCELLERANDSAKRIELQNADLSQFENEIEANARVNELIRLEFSYVASNGDSVLGLGVPDTADHAFPGALRQFFVSNASFTKRATGNQPMNCVEVFFDFAMPTLKIDLNNAPSNPTENRTVINVYGRDEDWVISTTEKISKFLEERSVFRPVIHGSGTYDYFIFLIFMPFLIWTYAKVGGFFDSYTAKKSMLFNVICGVYLLLLSLFAARFLFQYARWLFPPMEYYKKNRIGASIHRGVAAFLGLAVAGGAIYDIGKAIFEALVL